MQAAESVRQPFASAWPEIKRHEDAENEKKRTASLQFFASADAEQG
jgi:hypothetical protein